MDEEVQECIDPSLIYGPPAPESYEPPSSSETPAYEASEPGGPGAGVPFEGMYDGGSGVEFCERPADIPGLQQLGIAHWWLRTPNAEAGMGPARGGVPGEESSVDYPGIPTTINDHTGRGAQEGSSCVPVEQHSGFPVDQACVEEELALGRETGRWIPPFNDCHDTVTEILEKCRVYGEEPAWTTDPGSIDKYGGGQGGQGGASGY